MEDMAQEPYTKRNLVKIAKEVWQKHGERYRTLIPEYKRSLRKRRALGLTSEEVDTETIKNIPSIGILSCRNKRELNVKLKEYSLEKLAAEIIAVDMMLESPAFQTLEAYIRDYEADCNLPHP